MGGAVSQGIDNDDIINKLKAANYIRTDEIEKVFRLVDRGYYILEEDRRSYAYKDTAWRRGNLHLSAPCIYAQVLEGLQIEKGMSFLNLGSGTGYLSTMAGLLMGPYGTNHGVELHGDVIAYARSKLESFMDDFGAVDVLDFCKPQFVQGNAYLLDENVQQYDRVYCGAALLPATQESMRNLLKVGGILVAPVNDQLLQIDRTGDTLYNTKSLLPVSFSALVRTSQEEEEKNVFLPPSDILTLREMCRLEIRQRLRDNVEKSNADLGQALIHRGDINLGEALSCPNYNYPDTDEMSDGEDPSLSLNSSRDQLDALLDLATTFPMMRGIRNRNRILFSRDSLLGPPDEGTSSASATDERFDDNSDQPSTTEDESTMVCGSPVAERSLPQMSDSCQSQRQGNNSQEPSEDDVPSVLNEAFDICLRTTETALKRGLSESSAGDDNAHTSRSPPKSSDHKALKREKFDSGIGDEADVNMPSSSSDSDLYDVSDSDSELNEFSSDPICEMRLMRRRGLRKRQNNRNIRPDGSRTRPNQTAAIPKKYRELMTASIKMLPLPVPLKIYINYNRDL